MSVELDRQVAEAMAIESGVSSDGTVWIKAKFDSRVPFSPSSNIRDAFEVLGQISEGNIMECAEYVAIGYSSDRARGIIVIRDREESDRTKRVCTAICRALLASKNVKNEKEE